MENNVEESLSQDLPQALKAANEALSWPGCSAWMDGCAERGASHEIAVQQQTVSNNNSYIKSAVLHHAF